MARHSFVEIDLPEARKLESLTGIFHDLMRAQEFTKRLQTISMGSPQELALIEPLWIAAIVQYFRAFGGGARQNLNEALLSSLDAEQRKRHDWFYEVRGRHIVHSVNTFEKSQTVARYIEEDVTEKGIDSIQCNHTRVIGPSSQDVDKLIELSDTLLARTRILADQEKARILAIVRETPVGEVLSKGTKGVHQPDMDRPKRPRN